MDFSIVHLSRLLVSPVCLGIYLDAPWPYLTDGYRLIEQFTHVCPPFRVMSSDRSFWSIWAKFDDFLLCSLLPTSFSASIISIISFRGRPCAWSISCVKLTPCDVSLFTTSTSSGFIDSLYILWIWTFDDFTRVSSEIKANHCIGWKAVTISVLLRINFLEIVLGINFVLFKPLFFAEETDLAASNIFCGF